jgi:hypothetical protein
MKENGKVAGNSKAPLFQNRGDARVRGCCLADDREALNWHLCESMDTIHERR